MKTGKMLSDFFKLWLMIIVLSLAMAVGLGIDIWPLLKQILSWLIGG